MKRFAQSSLHPARVWPGNVRGSRDARPALALAIAITLSVMVCTLAACLVLAAGNASAQQPRQKRASAPNGLVGHGGPIKAVKVDAAGKRALTGSFDYSAILWDIGAHSPRRLLRLDAHDGAVNAVAFVPGADLGLTAGDDGDVRLWDLANGKLVHRFKGHGGKVNALAVSADGRLAASASWDGTARLWRLDTREPGPVLKGHKGPVNAVAFPAAATRVLTAGYDGTIVAWSTADGARQRTLLKHGWGINVLESVQGATRVAFGAVNGAAGIIEAASGAVVAELPAHQRPVLSLAAIDKPGLVATGGGEGIVRVYRQGDWKPIEQYQNPYGPIWAMGFVADGAALYYGGLDDFATLWQVTPRQTVEPIDSRVPRRFQVDDTVSEGERQFARKCSVCHTLSDDGRNRAGPTLVNLFGRRAGTVAGYAYSPALANSDIVWTAETVGKLFELGPDIYTPGSKMPLQKIIDASLRDHLIAYLTVATRAAATDARSKGSAR